jgi:hypothetical protein
MEKGVDNILIAVPCFGGSLHYRSANTLIQLDRALDEKGINRTIRFIGNDALVCRVRNRFANIAVFDADPAGRKFSHVLFLDADIAFDAFHIFTMLEANKGIVCLPYAAKSINWRNVAEAVKRGATPEQLPQFAGIPVFNVDHPFAANQITAVKHAGTGAMLIQTAVLKVMAEKLPDRHYKMCAGEMEASGTQRTEAVDFFKVGIYPGTSNYLSEDYFFEEDARRLGFETFLIPWAQTLHVGSHEFTMNVQAVASLGS